MLGKLLLLGQDGNLDMDSGEGCDIDAGDGCDNCDLSVGPC